MNLKLQILENNRKARDDFESALWSASVMRKIGAGVGILIFATGILFAALGIYFGYDWFLFVPPELFCAILAIKAKEVISTDVYSFSAAPEAFPDLVEQIKRKAALIGTVSKTEGYLTYYTDDRGKHLAVVGFFLEKGSATVWIFGKKRFISSIERYLKAAGGDQAKNEN